jgi:hypothetical protein
MAVTVLHTADWHLGKPFGSIEGDVAALLREERFDAVARLADLARERQVDAVIVAGDVFDSSTVPDQVIRRALEVMRAYSGPWVLLPGNHDPALAESPWTRLHRFGLPENVLPAVVREPLVLADGRLAVLPSPPTRRHEPDDITEWIVEIDRLDDGLTVIVGDNEEGKSTVLAALQSVLFNRYNLTGDVADAMLPYGSAVRPEISLDFDLDGTRHRLRKAFCQRPEVELMVIGSSGPRWTGAAAEERLREMLAFTPPGRGGARSENRGLQALFWVEQGSAHLAQRQRSGLWRA